MLLIISIIGDYVVEKYISFTPGFFCFRYLFLSVPAYIYLKGIKIKKILILILLSGVYLSLMLYSDAPERIDLFLPNGWEAQTSLGFFYTLFLYVLLSKGYEKIRNSKLTQYITYLGTISWEIFLIQMVLLGSGVIDFIINKISISLYMQIGIKVLMTLIMSIISGHLYRNLILLKVK